MLTSVKPRVFTSSPSSADMIDGDFVKGDIIVSAGIFKTYMGSGVWLTSQNDVVLPGSTYYVDSVAGSNTNSGQDWNAALKTIAAAVALAVAGDKILCKGSFDEAVVVAAALIGIAIVGVGTGPNRSIWTDSTVDTVCLTLNATDVLVAGFRFRPPAFSALAPAAILLGGADNARIIGNRFQGKASSYVAIYSPVCNSDLVEISDNEFLYMNTITGVDGSAILGVEAGGLSYSNWKIRRNIFDSCVEGVNICGRVCLLEGNHFGVNGITAAGAVGAVAGSHGSKKLIDLSGTGSGANKVHGNYLGGTYDSTLYAKGASLDDWAGNYNIAGITAANP
jgi:hypothetical protein